MITHSSKHYVILWFIILIYCISLSQQVNSWEHLQPAERINDFHFSNTLTGWAVTNRNSILYTKNGGAHWQTIRSRSASTYNSKVYCLDGDHAWVLNRPEFSFTVNGGKTWTDISIREQFDKLFDHLNPYNDTLDRTTMVAIVTDICFTTPQTGWASGSVEFISGMPAIEVPKRARFIFLLKSMNRGLSWDISFVYASDSNDEPNALKNEINDIYFVSQQKGWVACNNGFIYSTTDAGNNWIKDSIHAEFSLNNITFFNDTQGICFGQKYNGMNIPYSYAVFRTIDGGSCWRIKKMNLGLERVVDIAFLSPSKAFLINGPINHSTHSDDSMGIYAAYESDTAWNLQNLCTDGDFRKIQMFNSSKGWAVNGLGLFFGTTDGKSWNLKNRQLTYQNSIRDISFINSSHGWCIDLHGKIYKTIDSGLTWDIVADLGYTNFLLEINFIDSIYGWALTRHKILRTYDGGINWDSSNISVQEHSVRGIFFADARCGWLATIMRDRSGRIMCTNDSGKTWEFQNVTTPEGMFNIYFVDNKNGWAYGGPNIICRTRDAGNTWDTSSVKADNTMNIYNRIQFIDTLHGWLYSSVQLELLRTTDGGRNWTEIKIPSNVRGSGDMFFKDQAMGWIVGRGFILHSIDSGKTWVHDKNVKRILPIGYLTRLKAIEHRDGHMWICGESGTLLHSSIDNSSNTAFIMNSLQEMNNKNRPAFIIQKNCNSGAINIVYQLEKPCQLMAALYTLSGRLCRKYFKYLQKGGVYRLELISNQIENSKIPYGVYLLRVTDGHTHTITPINLIDY